MTNRPRYSEAVKLRNLEKEILSANRVDKQHRTGSDPHYSHQEIRIIENVAQEQRLPETYDSVALEMVRSEGLIARNYLNPVVKPWKITKKGSQVLYRSLGKGYE